MAKKREINFNKIYYNTKGIAFKIIKEIDPIINNNEIFVRRVIIRFIKSEYETIVYLNMVKENKPSSITDYLSPTLHDVGIIGYKMPRDYPELYNRWYAMICRCYSINSSSYKSYGAKGVYVCERWKRFDYFVDDAIILPGYEDMMNNPDIEYELDKDSLQQGCAIKVYSPETCIWMPKKTNRAQRVIDNKSKYSNIYYGVQKTKAGTYEARITDNDKIVNIGTYTNEIAAANAYNYYATILGRLTLNEVPYMSKTEFSKYLAQLIPMLADENRLYGVYHDKKCNIYKVTFCYNYDHTFLGTYTNPIAAANIYNYFCIIHNRIAPNNVPYMSLDECRKYMVNPRTMCTIVEDKIESELGNT